jgi:hypothetical protein
LLLSIPFETQVGSNSGRNPAHIWALRIVLLPNLTVARLFSTGWPISGHWHVTRG